jgi:hypothetical protein
MNGRTLALLLVVGGIVALLVLFPEVWEPVANAVMGTGKGAAGGTPSEKTSSGATIKVFRARGEEYYHLRDCPELEGKSAIMMPLDTAKALCQPCPVCKPPQ